MNARKKTIFYINLIFVIVSIIINILCLVWLFKVKNNSKKEPYPRDKYLIEGEDPLNYYTEGDFCYDHYYPYLTKGAFDDLDIRMTKIHKYSKALIYIFFIDLMFIILSIILDIISERKEIDCIKCIFALIRFILSILDLIFFIILSVNYYKSNFDDFEDFSECKYFIDTDFNKDYDFVFVVKRNFKKFFILTLITIGLNIIEEIITLILKEK